MKFDTRTLYEVRKRLEGESCQPLFFHEVKTPANLSRRIGRVMRWMGPLGWRITTDYYLRGEAPAHNNMKWSRHA